MEKYAPKDSFVSPSYSHQPYNTIQHIEANCLSSGSRVDSNAKRAEAYKKEAMEAIKPLSKRLTF